MMMTRLRSCFVFIILFGSVVVAAPTGSASSVSSSPTEYASNDPNVIEWNLTTNTDPQPIRGKFGAKLLGPQNVAIDRQNPDVLAPPNTDHGTLPNAKWPFSLSHNRLLDGGWARQQNVHHLPIAQSMAGVNMRLAAGAIRELHWHKTPEWAYVIKGYTQISAVNQDGQNYLATVGPGDLWYFPPGIPHALQATNDDPDGSEFLLIFPDGAFSDDNTLLITDWLAHVPKEVLAKNFQTDISAFDHIPAEELYIFRAEPPSSAAQAPSSPQGQVPEPYSFEFSKVNASVYPGGSVKVVDSSTFPIAKAVAVAEVTVAPGAMRELHWHPTQDEWGYFIEGEARMTLFGANGNAQTFDYQAGDISFVPVSFGHYVENIGNTTLRFLEIFNTDRYSDVSLTQWLALTPPELVKVHLDLPDDLINNLTKTKLPVVGPRSA